MGKYYLAIDQGTSSSRTILFNNKFEIIASNQIETSQYYPQDGWVEQNADGIYNKQLKTINNTIDSAGIEINEIECIGITNQRESFVIWDKESGTPLHPAIIWQDKRTSTQCETLKQQEISRIIKRKTGLVCDPYFSATKLKWIFDTHPEILSKAKEGKILFGTIDTWLVWKLSKGEYHITDVSNASRTMLMNIHTLSWDKELLDYFNVPESILPKIVDSSGKLAIAKDSVFNDNPIPITGIAGDQQAALFGQLCHNIGCVKNTYGTGCFMLMNVGSECPTPGDDGLLRTVAWRINNEVTYALEGSVFFAGATIKWMRDQMNLFESSADTENIAQSVPDTGGVYMVPAFAGLGTPYWDADARGIVIGLTQATTSAHFVRAGLESLAYQTRDVLELMQNIASAPIASLRVDGGASANGFLMQFQADILNTTVIRPKEIETTALGAAMLAAIGFGNININDLHSNSTLDQQFEPSMNDDERREKYKNWKRAVERSRDWI